MIPVAKELKLDHYQSYIISYNGGKTINAKTEEIEVSKSVTKDHFDKITDYCRKKAFNINVSRRTNYLDTEHEYRKIESELTGLPMKQVDDIKAYIQSDVPKTMGVDYEENISKARNELNGTFNSDIDVTTSKPFFLEFMAKDVSKGNAIKALCEKLNISLSEVICFGDSLNDQSMFKVVGYAVAMGNASEELKNCR